MGSREGRLLLTFLHLLRPLRPRSGEFRLPPAGTYTQRGRSSTLFAVFGSQAFPLWHLCVLFSRAPPRTLFKLIRSSVSRSSASDSFFCIIAHVSRFRRRHRRRDARLKQQRFRPHSAAYGDSDSGEKLYGDFGARGEVIWRFLLRCCDRLAPLRLCWAVVRAVCSSRSSISFAPSYSNTSDK